MKRAPEVDALRQKRRKGGAVLEGALSLMTLMLLLFGTMEVARGVQADTFCEWAANEAVRWASVRGAGSAAPATAQSVTDHVKSLAASWDVRRLTVTTTFTPNNDPGGSVRVTVAYDLAPVAGLVMTKSLHVSGTAQTTIMR